jgi:aspartokinase
VPTDRHRAHTLRPDRRRRHRRRHDHPERERGRHDRSHVHRPRDDYEKAHKLLDRIAGEIGAETVRGDLGVAKVSIVGLGMRTHAGVAARMFDVLAKATSTCR